VHPAASARANAHEALYLQDLEELLVNVGVRGEAGLDLVDELDRLVEVDRRLPLLLLRRLGLRRLLD
jgi:hypothetical protein